MYRRSKQIEGSLGPFGASLAEEALFNAYISTRHIDTI